MQENIFMILELWWWFLTNCTGGPKVGNGSRSAKERTPEASEMG
jgi:hypothetical protein